VSVVEDLKVFEDMSVHVKDSVVVEFSLSVGQQVLCTAVHSRISIDHA
jgi:hypothetical protein